MTTLSPRFPFKSVTTVSIQFSLSIFNNILTAPNEHAEDDVPIEGLININTASWRVLATLPLVVDPQTGLPSDRRATGVPIPYLPAPASGGATYRELNQELAKAIVYWRDVDANTDPNPNHPKYPHGPFRSIYELNQVVDLRGVGYVAPNNPPPGGMGYANGTLPGFANGYWTVPLAAGTAFEPDDSLGDLGPVNQQGSPNPPTDGVRGDFKERFLQLDRISNLITTRSDSFTCYILVQGWRDVEPANPNSPQPSLVVQRRVGIIVDRSRVTADPVSAGNITRQAFFNN